MAHTYSNRIATCTYRDHLGKTTTLNCPSDQQLTEIFQQVHAGNITHLTLGSATRGAFNGTRLT